jgi:integrase
VRLHEKGGKLHEMPCHHTLQGYLAEYVERARLAEAGRAALFQAIKYCPMVREAELNGERLHRINAWQMVWRRAKAAGITTKVCKHTFRGTGITAYLENRGRSRRRGRWRHMPPPAPRSSTTAVRTASRSTRL